MAGMAESWGIFLKKAPHRGDVTTWRSSLGIGAQGSAQIVEIVDQQMHADHFTQLRTLAAHAEGLDRIAVKAWYGARLVIDVMVYQRDLG